MKQFLILTILCWVIAPSQLCAGETPRSAVQLLLNAARQGDVAGVKAQMHSKNQFSDGDAEGILALKLMFDGAYISSVENVGEDRAVVSVSVKDPMTGERKLFPMSVSRKNGEWLIDDRRSEER